MGSAQMKFELCFQSLTGDRAVYSFPCDRGGLVDMDRLNERDRLDYLFARGSIGYALSAPAVVATLVH